MSLELTLVRERRVSVAGTLKEALRFIVLGLLRERLEHAVIGGGGAHTLEEDATSLERVDELSIAVDRRAVHAHEPFQRAPPFLRRDSEERVGTKCRDDPALPSRPFDRGMMLEHVRGGVRRRQRLDVESLEQRARPEFW